MNIVTIGFITEGPTDKRFLGPIIKKTFEEVAFECSSDIEIYEPQWIAVEKDKFVEEVLIAAQKAKREGIMVLCVHTDADGATDEKAFQNKIFPALEAVEQEPIENLCKNLVAIVPIRMTEAWILADKETLKIEIGTSKSDEALGLNKKPESFADPKTIIQEIIREESPNHRLDIGYLYSPIAHKIDLKKLSTLSAYQKFKDAVREAFRKLNYLH